MNKVRLLTITSIGMLTVNATLLVFMFTRKPNHPNPEGPKKIIIEKLDFDTDQVNKYEKAIQWHQVNIIQAEDQILRSKNQLYATLTSGAKQEIVDSLMSEINKQQLLIEQAHYKHFEDIKDICKPEQLKLYERFTMEITKLFNGKPMRKRPA